MDTFKQFHYLASFKCMSMQSIYPDSSPTGSDASIWIIS